MNDTNETYTYCGITASVSLWISAGMEVINWAGGTKELRVKDSPWGGNLTDGQLIEARITTGDTGEKALVWLIAERRRQSEERNRNEAIRQQADAAKKSGDDAIHAARIHRQAEELRCLANGISKSAINSRLE